MAVTPAHLTTGSDTSNATTYTTASITPTSGRLVLVAVLLTGTNPIPAPALSGCGLTWTLVDQTPAAARSAYVFRAMGTATTGALTITSSGAAYTSALWSVVEFAGTATTGTGGSGAIAQSFNSRPASATSVAEAFPVTPTAGNGAFGVVGIAVQENPTAGTGWTGNATSQASPTSGLVGLYAGTAPSAVNAAWTTSANSFVVGVEILASGGSSSVTGAGALVAAPATLSGTGTVATPAAPAPTAGVAAVDAYLYDLLRGPHFAYGYVEAWRSGAAVQVEIDGALTTRLPLTDGGIEVDGSTPGARRVLSASFAPIPGLFDALAPTGTELKAYLVLRGPDGSEQVTPQGVFGIDVQRMGYASNGDIKVTAPDRWKRVQDFRFLTPRASNPGSTVRSQIAALLNEAMPAGVTTVDLATSSATVPAQVWDRDRDKAIEDLAKAASLDVFMDRNGAPTIRDAPTLTPESIAWTVDSGDGGVLVDAEQERNRQRTYNLVVVNGAPNDGSVPFPTQFVWDSDTASPTYAGPDPVNHPELAGPFGVRPTFFSSPLLTSVSQALVAGHTILERVQGLAAQLTLTSITKPDLDDGDTILVKLPPETPNGERQLQVHIVDRISLSLMPSKTPMRIDTRSTVVGYEGAE